jgi:hypothetical protein
VDSAVSVTGAVTYDPGASFTFNGIVRQVTGVTMPSVVNNLWINSADTVVLSQSTTINGVLRLMSGCLDNSIAFSLGPGGSISYEGGCLLFPVSVGPDEGNLPRSFFVEQNYPNPFNPSTTIRFGLPAGSPVSVKVFNLLGQEVATLFEGRQSAGVHTVRFDASNLGSGIYLYRVKAGSAVETKRMIVVK